MAREPKTRVAIYTRRAAWLALIAAVLLAPFDRFLVVKALISLLSAVAVAEGVALMINWQGWTKRLTEDARLAPDGTFIANFESRMWFWRTFWGPVLIIFGLIILFGVE